MNPALRAESDKLARSWQQHEAEWLRDYLVAGVEDPRVNLQSILTRHFLVGAAKGPAPDRLVEEEYRFSAVMNWLLELARKSSHAEELEAVLFALGRGSDNAEGIELPLWITHTFGSLPSTIEGVTVPNYIERFLEHTEFRNGKAVAHQESLSTFCELWRGVLADGDRGPGRADAADGGERLRVLEPACGSANDFRFFEACGLGALIDYTGFDLCSTNVENARTLFPGARFETGNVFETAAVDKSFDCCVVHDLFEHLSLEGMQTAAREICRVTRRGISAGFFQMDEIPEHVIRPVEEYHWNLLSLARTQQLFAELGFATQAFHIGTFLRAKTGCDRYHNPNAYTLWMRASGGDAEPEGDSAR